MLTNSLLWSALALLLGCFPHAPSVVVLLMFGYAVLVGARMYYSWYILTRFSPPGIGHTVFLVVEITFFALVVSSWLAPETEGGEAHLTDG